MDSINTARLRAFPSSYHGHCNIQEIQTDHDQHYPKGALRIEIFSRKDYRVKGRPLHSFWECSLGYSGNYSQQRGSFVGLEGGEEFREGPRSTTSADAVVRKRNRSAM